MSKLLLRVKYYENGYAECDYYEDGTLLETYPCDTDDYPFHGYWKITEDNVVMYREWDEYRWIKDKFSHEIVNTLADKAILEE